MCGAHKKNSWRTGCHNNKNQSGGTGCHNNKTKARGNKHPSWDAMSKCGAHKNQLVEQDVIIIKNRGNNIHHVDAYKLVVSVVLIKTKMEINIHHVGGLTNGMQKKKRRISRKKQKKSKRNSKKENNSKKIN